MKLRNKDKVLFLAFFFESSNNFQSISFKILKELPKIDTNI